MQDRPRAQDLLDAIADYLLKEVLPAVRENDALAYKALVSWNMLGVVSRELKEGETHLNAELERLSKRFGESPGPLTTVREKMERVQSLNQKLSDQIRSGKILPSNAEVLSLVKKSLEEKLAVANPRSG